MASNEFSLPKLYKVRQKPLLTWFYFILFCFVLFQIAMVNHSYPRKSRKGVKNNEFLLIGRWTYRVWKRSGAAATWSRRWGRHLSYLPLLYLPLWKSVKSHHGGICLCSGTPHNREGKYSGILGIFFFLGVVFCLVLCLLKQHSLCLKGLYQR